MTQSLPPKSLVLYADDDRDDQQLVIEAFSDYAHSIELITFDNGNALLDYIKNLKPYDSLPCLVILDINMPGKNGKEVLRDLRRREDFNEVPVVLFSTSTLPSEAAFAHSFNAGFINKPLHHEHIDQLVEHIANHCTNDLKTIINKQKKN